MSRGFKLSFEARRLMREDVDANRAISSDKVEALLDDMDAAIKWIGELLAEEKK